MSQIDIGRHYPLNSAQSPNGWELATVGQVATDIRPGFASGIHNQEGQGIPHIRPMNIDRDGQIDLSQIKSVSPECNALRLRISDALFNNTNSPPLVGKTAAIIHAEDWGFSNHMTRIGLPTEMDNRFVAHQLHYLWMRGYFRHKCVNHVNQASISSTALSDTVPLLVAPTNEQRRIVGKIEELFSDLDAGVTALERAKANLKRYRAAVLKAAVEGKLTEQWRAENPATEPASKLLDRILAERRRRWEQEQLANFAAKGKQPPANWKAKYKEPAKPNVSNLPLLPDGWCWATIEQLNAGDRSSAYGVLQPGPDIPNGVPLVRVCDVMEGRVAIGQLKRIAPKISSQFRRTILRGGEVLLTIVGTIGRSAIAPESIAGANTARAVAVIPLSALVDARFVEINLRNPETKTLLTRAAHEVARKTLNLEDVRLACLPLAPSTEQLQIVGEVESLLSRSEQAEAMIETARLRSSRLRQAILKQAFEGKLVPQDPTDEPAGKLLERIAAERAAQTDGQQRKQERPRRKAASK